MNTTTSHSILISLLPLIGVVIGSTVTLIMTLVTTYQKSSREEYLYLREKVEGLYKSIRKYREIYHITVIEALNKCAFRRFDDLRGRHYMEQNRIEEVMDLIVEIRMTVDMYFPRLKEELLEINKAAGRMEDAASKLELHIRTSKNEDIVKGLDSLTDALEESLKEFRSAGAKMNEKVALEAKKL